MTLHDVSHIAEIAEALMYLIVLIPSIIGAVYVLRKLRGD